MNTQSTPINSVNPSFYTLEELNTITETYATQTQQGEYQHLIPSPLPEDHRWSTRIYADENVDVWLISWTHDQHTELHDHAGSHGALSVVSGELTEYYWTGTQLEQRIIGTNKSAAFPNGWVHDVTLTPTSSPALSVHAYSPPLTAMNYYKTTTKEDRTYITRERTVLTSEPESSTSSIDTVLADARKTYNRLPADQIDTVLDNGGIIVDIRPSAQRAEEGEITDIYPQALVIERNVLEWRLDPTSTARIPQANKRDIPWIILCSEGYTSSLAAAALQQLGLYNATDVIGGYKEIVKTKSKLTAV